MLSTVARLVRPKQKGSVLPPSSKNQKPVARTKSKRPTAVIDHGIRCIGSRELHVIGALLLTDALQHQLAGIRVFASSRSSEILGSQMRIAITSAKTITTSGAPTNAQCFAVIIDHIPHERCLFPLKTGHLQLGDLLFTASSQNEVESANCAQAF